MSVSFHDRWAGHWKRQWQLSKRLWLYALIIAPAAYLLNLWTTVTAAPWVIGAHTVTMFFLAPLSSSFMHLLIESFLVWKDKMPEEGESAEIGIKIICLSLGMALTAWLTAKFLEAVTDLRNLFAGPLLAGSALVLALLVILILYEGFRSREIALARFQSLQAEARFQNLSAQVQPHFLFNALNNLAELVLLNPAQGAEGLLTLARLYQGILEKSAAQTICLEEEIAIVKDYLAMQQLRFQDRVQIEWDVETESKTLPLPPFTLFNLVENAIKHGVALRIEPTRLRISSHVKEESWIIKVQNDRPPSLSMNNGAAARKGNGLLQVTGRLAFVYGEQASFNLEVMEDVVQSRLTINKKALKQA